MQGPHKVLASLLALCVLCSGCFSYTSRERVHKLKVQTSPAGAYVWQRDESGKQAVGRAPTELELPYTEKTAHFSHWNWLWPLFFGGATGASTAWALEAEDGGAKGVAWALVIVAGLGFLSALPGTIKGELNDGATRAESYQLTVGASLAGHGEGWSKISVPSDKQEITLTLAPSGQPATLGALMGTSMGDAPPLPKTRPIVAVFRIEDPNQRFDPALMEQMTEYLATQLTAVAGFRTIPRQRLRERLGAEKKQGYKACYDEACQIELGKAVAAQKSLATKLLHVGERCAITSVLYDLKTETSARAASAEGGCDADALMAGLRKVAQQLRR